MNKKIEGMYVTFRSTSGEICVISPYFYYKKEECYLNNHLCDNF